MNSYMLPHGTREVARPRSTMQAEQQRRCRRRPAPARPVRCARRRTLRGVDDDAGRGAVRGDRSAEPAADQLAGVDLAAAAVGELDGEQQQRDHQHHDRRREGPVRVPGQPDVDVLGVHARPSLVDGSAESRPSRSRAVNRSNSSPQPELSVRARPPSSTLTVPGAAWCDPNPDPAPTHHQRHQQPGHHRHRGHQHPHLRRDRGRPAR